MENPNYPLMLLGAAFLGAAGGAIGNAIKGQDIRPCTLGGLATGVFTVTTVYLWFIITGTNLPH